MPRRSAPIANVTTPEDTATAPISLTIGDVETPATALTVTATSSNVALVPDANLVLSGTGADRTLVVTPAANQAGTATITVTVSDGTASTPQTFTVTVTAVNDAPTLGADCARSTTTEDTATAPISLHDWRRRDAGDGADGDGDVVERGAGAGREHGAERDGRRPDAGGDAGGESGGHGDDHGDGQ